MPDNKWGGLQKQILLATGLAGVLVVGALCPGMLLLLRPLARKRYSYPACSRALKALDAKGWTVYKQTATGIRVSLTERGRVELLAYELGRKKLKAQGRWDGKWHVLTFDVPEKRKHLRDGLRNTLKNLGFHRLQDSVWVYPYDCRVILDLLRTKYRVRDEALYVRVDHLDNDRWLRRHFGLKSD